MKTADFRKQTTTPTAPSSSAVTTIYANASGALVAENSAGATWQAGYRASDNLGFGTAGTVTTAATATNGPITGLFYGVTGVGATGYVLGSPTAWLPIIGPSGQKWAIPTYVYV